MKLPNLELRGIVPFESSQFAIVFDLWVLQAVAASRFLAKLYRVLNDEQQAAAAIWAGQPATERMERHGLQTDLLEVVQTFELEHPDETEAEAAAWQNLIAAQAGQCLFFAVQVAKNRTSCPGFLGQSNAANKAFSRALISYRAAFPDAMVAAGVEHALLQASRLGAEAFSQDARVLLEEDRACMRQDAQTKFIDVLREQATLVLAKPASWGAREGTVLGQDPWQLPS